MNFCFRTILVLGCTCPRGDCGGGKLIRGQECERGWAVLYAYTISAYNACGIASGY